MVRITKSSYEKFMEDNFLDEDFDDLMVALTKMISANAEVIPDQTGKKGILRIEIKLV